MTAIYPTVFTELDDGYMVYVPDLDCNTQGDDLVQAIEMARDVIGMVCIDMQDDGKQLPVATPLSAYTGDIVSLVDVDIDAYRRARDQKAERRNITLPHYMNEWIKQNNVNMSALAQEIIGQKMEAERGKKYA